MSIDEKLKNMRPKDTPLLVLGYMLLGMILLLAPAKANAGDEHNHVHIDQEGDNLVLDILQAGKDQHIDLDLGLQYGNVDNLTMWIGQLGEDNEVEFSVSGDGNTVKILQEGRKNFAGFTSTWGKVNCNNATFCGDVDGINNDVFVHQVCTAGANCQDSEVGFHVWGDSNLLRWGQGVALANKNDTTFGTDDGGEYGGHKIIADFHGDNNKIVGYQTNGNTASPDGHTANLWIYADDNDFWAKQQNDMSKNLTVKAYNDANVVSIIQKNNAEHTATVLLYGSQPTTLDLLQQGSTAQSYSINQTCHTSGGCSISVTQE